MIDIQLNCGLASFGNSVTKGQAAVNAANYWVNRFVAIMGGTLDDRAVSGTGLPDMVKQSCAYMPYGGRTKIVAADGPLNDVRQAGASCIASVKPALDAFVSNAFSSYFRGAAWPATGSAPVVKTGTWASLSGYTGRSNFFGNNPMSTQDPTATITFTFSGPMVTLHGFASETNDWLNLDIEIDGSPWGSTNWEGIARPGAGKQAVALVIEGLSSGAHTIKLKPPATGIPTGKACVVDGVQMHSLAAPVLLGSIPNIGSWTALGSIGTWTQAQSVNAIIEQVANEWKARGFPVGFVDLTTFIDPSRDFSADLVHPHDRGQLNWLLGYLAAVRIKP